MTISDSNAETRTLCDADSTSYPDATLLRRTNANYEEVVSIAIKSNGKWEFDDSNFTTHPIGTATLVAGQQDYSFDVAFLDILSLSVKDVGGIWKELSPLDKSQFSYDPDEYFKTDGMPVIYDKMGESVFLYPAPAAASVTTTYGLKAYFQRTADIFTSAQVTTGTKEFGFASTFHKVIPYMNAIPYCMMYKPDRVAQYQSVVDNILGNDRLGIVGTLQEFYSKRAKDEKTQIIPIYHSSR
jgi:hypothetical protein